LEETRNQFADQQKKENVERQRQISTIIPMEPTLENVQRVMVNEQFVDDMVQFQAVPITNMIPNADRQKQYRKRKLDELTAQEQEEQRKRNVDRQKTYRERKLKQLEERRNLNGHAQCGTIKDKSVEIDDNISVPSEEMYTTHRKFRERIDRLAKVQMCHVCLESYAGIQVRNTSTGPMCMRCL